VRPDLGRVVGTPAWSGGEQLLNVHHRRVLNSLDREIDVNEEFGSPQEARRSSASIMARRPDRWAAISSMRRS
jgi:hypothetical protein